MTLTTSEISPRIGTAIMTDAETLLSGRIAGELRAILEQRGVLLLRGLAMDDDQLFEFGKTLGEPRVEHGSKVWKISADARVNALAAAYTEASAFFHFDDTYMQYPALASVLKAQAVAPAGGQTEFANTYAMYADLSAEDKLLVDGLKAVHSQETIQRKVFPDPTDEQLAIWSEAALPATIHPLVWEHRTGRKSLLLGNTIRAIIGLDPAAGDALLQRLLDMAEDPQYRYAHDWQVGDIIIWDNTGTMHRVVPFDLTSGREVRRVKLAGEEPITPPGERSMAA